MLCDILGVSKSRYYEWSKQPISKRQQRIQELDYMITEVFNEHKSRYGATRICYELKLQGVMCTRKMISNNESYESSS
jgi:transposase InsO family protein